MRKSADAVTLMQQSFDISDVKVLFPSVIDWKIFEQYRPDVPFIDEVIDFLSSLSGALLKDRASRMYPDVITFAFFCRKGNLLKLKEGYTDDAIRLGRGIIFHIAPSNVPINFGYSLISGLLAGDCNVVRCSNKDFPQVDIVIKNMLIVAESFPQIAKRIAVVRYEHTSQANDYFSSICQARVIWGGDETIARIRKCELPSRSFDVTFADRYSFAIINADGMVKEQNMSDVAGRFYNDTYLFDQNACSAPHLVVWTGSDDNKKKAKDSFWQALHEEVIKKQYHFQPVMAVDKITAFYRQSQAMDIETVPAEDNLLVRVKLNALSTDIDDYRCKCGYFSEYDARDIKEIVPIIKYKYQTMAYYGFSYDELRSFVVDNRLIGIDRIVPFGKTTDFSLSWDGYDLVHTLSRSCYIK